MGGGASAKIMPTSLASLLTDLGFQMDRGASAGVERPVRHGPGGPPARAGVSASACGAGAIAGPGVASLRGQVPHSGTQLREPIRDSEADAVHGFDSVVGAEDEA